jgi:hypothetical protein
LSVNFLFHRDGADGTRAKSHSGSSVTFHVLVDGKGGIVLVSLALMLGMSSFVALR